MSTPYGHKPHHRPKHHTTRAATISLHLLFIAAFTQQELKEILAKQVPEKAVETHSFLKEYGSVELGNITIAQAYGGARGVKCMVWETSNLDPDEVQCRPVLTCYFLARHVHMNYTPTKRQQCFPR